MPTRTVTDHAGRVEVIEADRIEDDGKGWSWWMVVVVIHEPWWACVRRISASDMLGGPSRLD